MAGFKAPCPSCDHGVPVQDTKLIGTKIECPKCKYRFKVETPKDMPAADAKGKEKKDKDKSKKPAAEPAKAKEGKGGKPDRKMLIGIVLGVVAIALLVVGGLTMFGGADEKPKGNVGIPPKPVVPPKPTVPTKKDNETPVVPPKDPPKVDVVPEVKLVRSDKNATNLLPAATQAVVRADFNTLMQTPLYNIVVTEPVTEVLKSALGLEPAKVASYVQAYVDAARLPFAVIRLREPMAEKDVLEKLTVSRGAKSPVQGREYHSLKLNAAQNAMGKLLTVDAILGARATPSAPTEPRPFAVCVYDTQTILLADEATLEAFLMSLQPNGYPAFQTEFVKSGPGTSTPTEPAPKVPNPKEAKGPAPKTPKAPAVTTPPKSGNRIISSNPDYCTIPPELKLMLNTLENEVPAVAVLASRLNPQDREWDLMRFSIDARPWAMTAATTLVNASMVVLALRTLTTKDATFQVIAEAVDSDEARNAKERLVSMSSLASTMAAPLLGHRIEMEGFSDGAETPPPPVPMPMPMVDGALPLGPSKLSLNVADRYITVTGSLTFNTKTYDDYVWPRMRLFGAQFQGQLLVLSGPSGRRMLAPVVSQIAATGQFPRGTLDRQTGIERYGLPHPPATRVSFFYDLLPYLGKGETAGAINPKQAWFTPQNLSAGEAWVPELLVPEYPSSAWRASSPYAEGRSLGATNVVGIAGKGRDAGRYTPTDPARAKQLGVVGYDWGSKTSEITDGTANTIYMLQVPPNYPRPWIAGGGATVAGIDDTLPNPVAEFASQRGDRNGTYAVMADGSVRWIPANIDKNVFLGLVTRAGGESLGDLDAIAPKDATLAELKTPKK